MWLSSGLNACSFFPFVFAVKLLVTIAYPSPPLALALVFVEMTELIRFNCGKHARFIHIYFLLYLIIINHLLPCYSHTLKWICSENEPSKRMQCKREKFQLLTTTRSFYMTSHFFFDAFYHFYSYFILHTRVHTAHCECVSFRLSLQQCSRLAVDGEWNNGKRNIKSKWRGEHIATNQIVNRRMQVDAHTLNCIQRKSGRIRDASRTCYVLQFLFLPSHRSIKSI